MAIQLLYDVPFEIFQEVRNRVLSCVKKHEKKRGRKHYQDCVVLEDDYGPSQILFYVMSLDVLTPRLVASLKRTMKAHPNWEVVAIICPPDGSSGWPEMGLRIRGHEIIDDLQRNHFPSEFKNLKFEGARPSSVDD